MNKESTQWRPFEGKFDARIPDKEPEPVDLSNIAAERAREREAQDDRTRPRTVDEWAVRLADQADEAAEWLFRRLSSAMKNGEWKKCHQIVELYRDAKLDSRDMRASVTEPREKETSSEESSQPKPSDSIPVVRDLDPLCYPST